MTAAGMFPLLASRFFKDEDHVRLRDEASAGSSVPSTVRPARTLRVLDLASLPRDDGPPTELRTRKEKLAHFGTQCTYVGDHLYVGGETVARSLETLQEVGITHVINCVGFLYPSFFEKEFAYQTLYLQDTPSEDILCVLYDVFDFIQAAGQDGRVFIHCSQGVSRSCTFAIAYRMWAEDRNYDDVFEEVKQMRGVANPNIGFTCQLITWHKRRHDEQDLPRLYRIAPQSASAPLYLVAKAAARLDPRGAFVLHVGANVYLWMGASCPDAFVAAARRTCDQLRRYEDAYAHPTLVRQGSEPPDFWASMETVAGEEGRRRSLGATRSPSVGPADVRNVWPLSEYDRDYELYQRALAPPSARGETCDSARSGRKTPRVEAFDAVSPNDRLRKQARNEARERERERTARSSGGTASASGSSYGFGMDSARGRALDFQEMAVRRHVATPRDGAVGGTLGRYGRSSLTPRGDATVQPSTTRMTSRFAVPRLALPQQQSPQIPAASAVPRPIGCDSSGGNDAEDDSEDDDLTSSASMSDLSDSDQTAGDEDSDVSKDDEKGKEEELEEHGDKPHLPTPPSAGGGASGAGKRTPPAVPRLNLSRT